MGGIKGNGMQIIQSRSAVVEKRGKWGLERGVRELGRGETDYSFKKW